MPKVRYPYVKTFEDIEDEERKKNLTPPVYPNIMDEVSQNISNVPELTEPTTFGAEEAVQFGVKINEGWNLKLTPAENERGFTFSLIEPEGWELFDEGTYRSPEGDIINPAQVRAIKIMEDMGAVKYEDYPEDFFPSQPEEEEIPDYTDIINQLGIGADEQFEMEDILGYYFPEAPDIQALYPEGGAPFELFEETAIAEQRFDEFQKVMQGTGDVPTSKKFIQSLFPQATPEEVALFMGEDPLQTSLERLTGMYESTMSSLNEMYGIPPSELKIELSSSAVTNSERIQQLKFDLRRKYGEESWWGMFEKEWETASKEFAFSEAPRALMSEEERAYVSGAANVANMLSGGLDWLGAKGVADNIRASTENLKYVRPIMEEVPTTWSSVFSAKWWHNVTLNLAEMLPFQMALLPFGILGYSLGTGAATILGITSNLLRGVFGAATGGVLQGFSEAFIEAGAGYTEALSDGMTEKEASDVAQNIFWSNATLLIGSNALQLFVGLRPVNPVAATSSLVRRGLVTVGKGGFVATTQAGEELAQELIKTSFLGQEFVWDEDMKMLAVVAGLAGLGQGAAMDAVSGAMNNTIKNLSPEQSQAFTDAQATLPEDMPQDVKDVQAIELISKQDPDVGKKVEASGEHARINTYDEAIKPKTKAEQLAWDKIFEKQHQEITDRTGVENIEEIPTVQRDISETWDVMGQPAQTALVKEAGIASTSVGKKFGDLTSVQQDNLRAVHEEVRATQLVGEEDRIDKAIRQFEANQKYGIDITTATETEYVEAGLKEYGKTAKEVGFPLDIKKQTQILKEEYKALPTPPVEGITVSPTRADEKLNVTAKTIRTIGEYKVMLDEEGNIVICG